MKNTIEKLKKIWGREKNSNVELTSEIEVSLFQKKNRLIVPYDLVDYFKQLNGTNEEYDDRFFKFYSFSNFKSINEDLKNWSGVPDYSNIVNTLADVKYYFVFADFSFCMFSYAIKLNADFSTNNHVIVICGDEYKVIASSFSEFIDLYLINSIELQLNKGES